MPLTAVRPLPAAPSTASGLLERSYADLGAPPPALVTVATLPAAMTPLLDHTSGMTRALERHWQAPITLSVRHRTRAGSLLRRVISLSTPTRPVAFGLIEIDLAPLPAAVRDAVVAESAPFGAILAQAGLRFASHPQRFFTLDADLVLARSLDIPVATRLYGRETQLDALLGATGADTPDGWTALARVVEIVPPR